MTGRPVIVLVHGFWGGAAHWSKVIVELGRMGYQSLRAVENPLTSLADGADHSPNTVDTSLKTAIVIGPASHRPRRDARAAHHLNRMHLQTVLCASTSEIFDRPLTRARVSFFHAPRAAGRRT
jgi:hypothetical protein